MSETPSNPVPVKSVKGPVPVPAKSAREKDLESRNNMLEAQLEKAKKDLASQGQAQDSGAPTKMIAPHPGIKLVKIKAVRNIRMYAKEQQHLPKGQRYYYNAIPGEEIDVPESIAEECCAKNEGQYAFGGERLTGPEVTRHPQHKATLVS